MPALAADDLPLAGLLSLEYLADGGFDRLLAEARDFGVRLRRRIDTAIGQDVLPVLGRELGLWAGDEAGDDERRGELEAAAPTFVFRALSCSTPRVKEQLDPAPQEGSSVSQRENFGLGPPGRRGSTTA